MKVLLSLTTFVFFISLQAQENINALFLGNSYTYYNNLPVLIENLANTNGDIFTHDQNAPGGYQLVQHVTNATTLNKIAAENWDYVVIQEQSQKPSFSPAQVATDVKPYAETLNDSVKANNICTKTMFFMTWGRKNGDASNCPNYTPLCTYAGMQQRLRESYLEMAVENNAECSPVGVAWKTMRDSFPNIELYTSDESHPSIFGSYLAACVFYSSMFHKTTVGNTYWSTIDSLSAFRIQTIASATVLDSFQVWNIDTTTTFPTIIDSVITACDSLEINGTRIYNDTMFSDTTGISGPCDGTIYNYEIEIQKSNVSIDLLEQLYLSKSEILTSVFLQVGASNADSIKIFREDSLVYLNIFENFSDDYYLNCGEDNYNTYTFMVVCYNKCGADTAYIDANCSDYVSVSELSLTQWDISPNPVSNFVKIDSEMKRYSIKLIDVLGKEIIALKSTNNGKVQCDLSHLQKGIYFINIYDENGVNLGQKKILKNQ